MDKMKMQTNDLADENFKKLKALFPNAVTETIDENGEVVRAIDKDVLRQEINAQVVDGPEERYQFTWPGKRESIRLAAAPIAASLRPCREESVNFDTTENVYIEGDNLDVLKLLRETYLGKVKMIYIDPPYNTGNDFIYEDDFSGDTDEFLLRDNQYDDQGNRLVQNTDSNGRFHTDWLNMMYPRLRLAKDLLREDGIIFISIDDNEIMNIRKICDDIFGSDNFLTSFIWEKRKTRENRRTISVRHDYIVCYVKDMEQRESILGLEEMNDESIGRYKNPDNDPRGPWTSVPAIAQGGHGTKNQFYTFVAPNGKKHDPPSGSCWRYTWDKMQEAIKDNRIWFGATGNNAPRIKKFLTEGKQGLTPESLLSADKVGTNDSAKRELVSLFDGLAVFETPKPVSLLQHFVSIITNSQNGIFLDFFSGTATFAHSILQQSAKDGCMRKYVLIQLPEESGDGSEAKKAGYRNICELGEERIRRAGKKIKEDLAVEIAELEQKRNKLCDKTKKQTDSLLPTEDQTDLEEIDELISVKQKNLMSLDTGFRVFKLDSSNMKDVYYNPGKTEQKDLLGHVDNIKEDRTPEDLLFQVMLEFGIPLSSKIRKTSIAGKDVFNVEDNYLIACFDDAITEETITAIAKDKPQYVVLRDSGFKTDSVAANFEQIFATYSPDTTRRVL